MLKRGPRPGASKVREQRAKLVPGGDLRARIHFPAATAPSGTGTPSQPFLTFTDSISGKKTLVYLRKPCENH